MSGFAGIFLPPPATSDRGTLDGMLDAMRPRGGGPREQRAGAGWCLGICRHGWELGEDFHGGTLLVSDGGITVAADATLFHTGDLGAALARAGVVPTGGAPGHLILAAYRAWGADCVHRLEGDFAFALWDAERATAFCARDFSGRRPLFFAEAGRGVTVASSVGALRVHPRGSAELNLAAVAEDASGLTGSPHETVYHGIARLPAGWRLSWSAAAGLQSAPFWRAPEVRDARGPDFHAGAEELRRLLGEATRERLARSGPTGIWLSGGWDSMAVFAIGQEGIRARDEDARLLPVSMSYPEGDPGREDELIVEAARHWERPVHWISIDDVPFWDSAGARAAERDEPFAHAFETWNRALARGTRSTGVHVNLDGTGGDQLFQVSTVYFADLLRRGRLLRLAREWEARGLRGRGARAFADTTLRPLLPPWAVGPAARLRGSSGWPTHLDRTLPPWIQAPFARSHDLAEREQAHNPLPWRGERASVETWWYLTYTHFHRVAAVVNEIALTEGVELRSPLFDERVVRFAVTRPRWERATGADSKLLLRQAMRGLVPPMLIAPRRWRTGVTTGYFERSLRGSYAPVMREAFTKPVLQELGIVDAEELSIEHSRFLRGETSGSGLPLFLASQTELWLRAKLGDPRGPAVERSARPSVVATPR